MATTKGDTDLAVVVGRLIQRGWEKGITYTCGTTEWYLHNFRMPVIHLYTSPCDNGMVAHISVRREPRRIYKTYAGLVKALEREGWL